MRQQPIWHSLRFWTAAFYDAVQSEREHRLAMRIKKAEKRLKAKEAEAEQQTTLEEEKTTNNAENSESATAVNEEDSSSSSHNSKAMEEQQKQATSNKETDLEKEHLQELRLQENILFKQLG